MIVPPPFNACGDPGEMVDCRLRLVDDGRVRIELSCVKVAMALDVLSRAKAANVKRAGRLDFEASCVDGRCCLDDGDAGITPRSAMSRDSEVRVGGSLLLVNNSVEPAVSIYGESEEEKLLSEDEWTEWDERWWLSWAWDVFVRAIYLMW